VTSGFKNVTSIPKDNRRHSAMVGIDWVSAVILLVGFAVSNIGTLPLKVRNMALAASCFGVAGYRMSHGTQGMNGGMVLLAAGFGLMYLFRAFRT
jgi:hypothetical protein